MRQQLGRFRTKVAFVAAAAAAAGGFAVALPARATSSFTLQRIQGSDRFQTAGAVNQAAYPSGEPNAFLADGIPGHETDALAAAGLEGVDGIGAFVTDNTSTVPANTLSALSTSKVKNIAVLGGTAAVSQAQIDQLKADGYNVTTPYAGAGRYQTMLMIDSAITPSQVGKDAAGNPTAILASGDDKHFVDALSAGGLAYAQKFPIILTNSQGPALQPEAQQVITNLGIKHLIVVGGTASIPSSEYNPPPQGVTTVTVESGADRSGTSKVLADYAVFNSWLNATNMAVARGDDGSDALAGSAFAGVNKVPTVVTNSPTDSGSAPSYASEHKSTLAGTSWVFGGAGAVTDSQVSAIEVAGGAASTATPGTIAPKSDEFVTTVSSTSFVQSGQSYAYGPSDTYQLAAASSTPGASPSCNSDSYADFQTRLSQGDQITGTYKPGGTSTFCLNDIAPPPPSSITAAGNTSSGGVTVTWSAPGAASADGITGYQVWRAPATVQSPQQPPQFDTCPSAFSVSPGSSPQTAPTASSGYTVVGTVTQSSTSGSGYSFNDTTATNPNYYCYAVSSLSPNATGGNATATAAPANAAQLSNPPGSAGTPVQATLATSGAAPALQAISVMGQTVTLTYNMNVNPASVDANGSDFAVTVASAATTSRDWASGSQVFLDLPSAPASGTTVGVTSQSGADGNTVCAANSTSACEKGGDTQSTSTEAAGGAVPKIQGVVASASAQTVTITYSEAIDCATVDPSAGQFAANSAYGPPGAEQKGALHPSKAACSGSGATSTQVVLSMGAPMLPGASVIVSYTPDTPSSSNGNVGPIVGSGSSEPTGDTSAAATVGQ